MKTVSQEDLFGVTLKNPVKGGNFYVTQPAGKPATEWHLSHVELVDHRVLANGDVHIVAPRAYLAPMGFPLDNPASGDLWKAYLSK